MMKLSKNGKRIGRPRKNEAINVDAKNVVSLNRPVAVESNETDAEISHRISERFRIVKKMTEASCTGIIRSIIIQGPPGLGKSYTVEKAVAEYDPLGTRSAFIKGVARATGIYKVLYENRQPGRVVVFDDCDSIFWDMDSLNLLKTACDTTERRVLTWGAETNMTDARGAYLPTQFEFEGTIIFITNMDFDMTIEKGGKMAEHFEALISRSHYIDTGMRSIRDYLVRIDQVVKEGLLESSGINAIGQVEIINFVKKHATSLRELTLRMVIKLADVYKLDPVDWKNIAEITLIKRK